MTILSLEQLRAQIHALNAHPDTEFYTAREFVALEPSWVNGQFAVSISRDLSALGVDNWEEDDWMCGNFGLFARSLMQIDNARNPDRPKAAAAFGAWAYIRDGNGPESERAHCIDFFSDGESIHFWEPQNQSEVTLSKTEIESCNAVIV